MAAVLFPSNRVNAVPLQYDPTFADLAGRTPEPSRLPETPYLDLMNSFEWKSDMSTNAGVLAQAAHMQQQAAIPEQVVRMAATRGDIPWRDAEALARPPAPGVARHGIHEPARRRDAEDAHAALMRAAEQGEARVAHMASRRAQQDLIA